MSTSEIPPVLILIFNRPEKVRTLLESLAKVAPPHVYIFADGPRARVPTDAARCAEARLCVRDIPWPCTVHTSFSDTNLGVDTAVETGITWFFEHVTEGIILEDDCIPHPDFFEFTHDMLLTYRNEPRILMISGNNFQQGTVRGDGSYYFSHYTNTWGWATWKRAWDLYDTSLSLLPEFIQNNRAGSIRPHRDEQRHWLRYFTKLYKGLRTAWDGKWLFAAWAHGGLSIVPNQNLVTNIGFGSDATHTKRGTAPALDTSRCTGPYTAPSGVAANEDADRYLFNTTFRVTVWDKIRYKIMSLYDHR